MVFSGLIQIMMNLSNSKFFQNPWENLELDRFIVPQRHSDIPLGLKDSRTQYYGLSSFCFGFRVSGPGWTRQEVADTG